ncbi:MAG: bifunctional folylpolyglutamate synthase/dihydrofolate synthase [Clostridia bacterium]|nr:bifunctional folylpolyglutamate synthase/dihydrofolate synthase [Clostridia bacterium]
MTNAVEKIHQFERFGSRLGLERMNRLLELLGNPEKSLRVIHVAGTNGKGSVCRYIYEALRANDYKTGLYTSPFIEVFNERIEYDGKYISDEDLDTYTGRVLEKVDAMIAEGAESPTEFEVITAVAFLYFADVKPDFVVLEVGLGGRGDSTNVVKKPLAEIITSISFDHTDRLGDTLEKIALEKAGIIKENTPVIMNVKPREAQVAIARKAYEKNCVLFDVSAAKYAVTGKTLSGYFADANILGTDYSGMEICMPGDHQIQNLLTAVTALEVLRKERKIKVERSRLYAGLKRARQLGRFEMISENPCIILDGAHNPDGSAALAKTVRDHFEGKKILLVCGMLADKDIDGILENFLTFADEIITTEPDSPRKLGASALREVIVKKKPGIKVTDCADSSAAADLAASKGDAFDLTIYAGSLYLIGKIRGKLKK